MRNLLDASSVAQSLDGTAGSKGVCKSPHEAYWFPIAPAKTLSDPALIYLMLFVVLGVYPADGAFSCRARVVPIFGRRVGAYAK
jgi:hypothetical protein